MTIILQALHSDGGGPHGAGAWPSPLWCTMKVLDGKKEGGRELRKEKKVIKEGRRAKNVEGRKYINWLTPSLQNTFKKKYCAMMYLLRNLI